MLLHFIDNQRESGICSRIFILCVHDTGRIVCCRKALGNASMTHDPALYTKYMLAAHQAIDLFVQESSTLREVGFLCYAQEYHVTQSMRSMGCYDQVGAPWEHVGASGSPPAMMRQGLNPKLYITEFFIRWRHYSMKLMYIVPSWFI